MPKPLRLPLQVGVQPYAACYKSDNRFLIVVPCPRLCWSIVVDCSSTLLLLLTSRDVEQNPGPRAAEFLQQIIDNQEESDDKINAITNKIAENEKREKMNSRIIAMRHMQKQIEGLENIVQQQAERLVDYENRSRRNILLIFGFPEARNELEVDLRDTVVDSIFKGKLGVEAHSVERIHRVGKKRPGKVRPVIMKFMAYRGKAKGMRNYKKLKGTSFGVSNEYSKETAAPRKKLWES